jgi:hypothetical protein
MKIECFRLFEGATNVFRSAARGESNQEVTRLPEGNYLTSENFFKGVIVSGRGKQSSVNS